MLCGCGRKPEKTPAGPNTVTVTFTEGKTIVQIANLLEENGVCSAEAFLDAAAHSDSDFLTTFDPDDRAFPLEGYVFPDTYEFYKNSSAETALNKFLNNAYARLKPDYRMHAENLGYTMDEILTIASIIQKEAGVVSEMKKVSSVLHNRLKSGMKLQCDVTYFYLKDTVMPYFCGEEWDDAVYEKYADRYYTYRIPALPAGPICNPGIAAIEAALYPEDTNYMFFFSDANGVYHYSVTGEEHMDKYAQAQK